MDKRTGDRLLSTQLISSNKQILFNKTFKIDIYLYVF